VTEGAGNRSWSLTKSDGFRTAEKVSTIEGSADRSRDTCAENESQSRARNPPLQRNNARDR